MHTYIRPVRASDRATLVALWERSVRATHDFLPEGEIESLLPEVVQLLAGDLLELWILADEADVPIGFLGLVGDSISALFIEPSHLRNGGGSRLVDHAQQLRGGALSVDVNEQNESARRFYEALGFRVVGRSPDDDAGRPYPLLHLERPAPAIDQLGILAVK